MDKLLRHVVILLHEHLNSLNFDSEYIHCVCMNVLEECIANQTKSDRCYKIYTCTSSRQQGRSETEEYSSESESESEDEEELQIILEDLQRQNEELEVRWFSVQ